MKQTQKIKTADRRPLPGRQGTWNYRYEYETVIEGHKIEVNKTGGGTVGKSYVDELWNIRITDPAGEMAMDPDVPLRIGRRSTHAEAAQDALNFIA